ncbi:hypothetical protein AM1BK_24940 [Neobacillus kokaensis]|uniref:Uncharacterized protein n=1 Tax=Neobacillus kokaensis TaxID=2759023 RepID=A0ABQ3NAB9_9BACI|nr:hypothetical protein AM1BK_24940 [Neobacillus kokaensis]
MLKQSGKTLSNDTIDEKTMNGEVITLLWDAGQALLKKYLCPYLLIVADKIMYLIKLLYYRLVHPQFL